MAKTYTRKQLRKPDEFISLSMKVWSFVQERVPFFLLSMGVAALIIGGLWTWTHFATKRAMKRTATLTRAFEIYGQAIIPGAAKLPPGEDGMPRFSSREEKLRAAERELSEAVSVGGDLGLVALALRAGVRYDRGSIKEALEDYQKFIGETEDGPMRTAALEGLGYCYEAQKAWDKAIEQFRKLPREGTGKHLALYHEARILAKKGAHKQAASLFRQIVGKDDAGFLGKQASEQLALLESK